MLQMIDLNQLAEELRNYLQIQIDEMGMRSYERGDERSVDGSNIAEMAVEFIKDKAALAVGEVETMSAGEVIWSSNDDDGEPDTVYYRWVSTGDEGTTYSRGSIYSSPPVNERWDITRCSKSEFVKANRKAMYGGYQD